MATNVVIQQSQVPTVMAGQFNDWSTGICECFDDMAICCFGYWCPLCFACKTSTDFGECVCLPVMDSLWTITICFGVPTCVPPVAFAMRVGARNRYNIQGDMCTDCITATFCNTCSWCQIAREIKRHKRNMTVVNAQPNESAPHNTGINAKLMEDEVDLSFYAKMLQRTLEYRHNGPVMRFLYEQMEMGSMQSLGHGICAKMAALMLDDSER
ncbi:hypothetical protein COCON_G00054090 [Conger conger]|uniref:Uncharacterized protein n=1 Tax=Conger conger TaxID=82655 RepID=A0A9Q1DW38_CONCO|nr:hypothetical protein COCON_G00054090 [Conger conger]